MSQITPSIIASVRKAIANGQPPELTSGEYEQFLQAWENRFAPGRMGCAKCRFKLNRINLNVNVGTVTAGDNKTEPCPNGCGPLWPITWEQDARESMDMLELWVARATTAEKLLQAAMSALRSYQYGNASTELAQGLADKIQAHLQPGANHGQVIR